MIPQRSLRERLDLADKRFVRRLGRPALLSFACPPHRLHRPAA